jgi:GT2 family glycosyltransferase
MLTVLMATYNGANTLPHVLNAYCALEPPDGGWKLVIVDNGSTDETKAVIARYEQRLPLTYCFEPKQGKNAALNTGLSAVSGDLIVFTDDDALPCVRWLEEYRSAADLHREYSIFCGPILPKWETPPHDWILKWVPLGPTFAILSPKEEGPVPPRLAFGANMALRTAVFAKGYRFDESAGPKGSSYPMGSETGLTRRLDRAGFKAWHCMQAVIYHMIRSEQLNLEWILRRAILYGRGQYRLAPKRAGRVPAVLGGVRVSLSARIALKSISLAHWRLARDEEKVFKTRWELNYLIGQLREALVVPRKEVSSALAQLKAQSRSPTLFII